MAENLNTLYYALELDDVKMQQSFQKDIEQLSRLDDEFNKINSTISKTFGQKLTFPIHDDIKQLSSELELLREQWEALNIFQKRGTEGTQISDKYKKLSGDINELNKSLASLYKESLRSAKTQEKLAAAQEKAEKLAMDKYYASLAREEAAFAKAQEKAAISANKLAQAQERQRSKQSAGEFKEYIQSLTKQSDISRQMSAYYKSLERQTAQAASVQKGLAAQIGLANKEFTLQSRLLSNLKTLFTTYVSIFAVKSFIQNLAQVRGEFENQQIALRAILRDAEAADRIFSQIKSFAVISPFEFKDLVGYAKQLSAFQVPVNELFETTKRLADVSAGLGVGMDRIILAYGQVRSAAVLRGQELRQFTEAGIPLVDELAKKFSELEGRVVSAGDVFEKISNRMVSFEMVKEIFEDMTNEGGMFYQMQEKQAESLKGKIANLADAYDIMLNDIGQANDGILKGGVEGIAALFSNWEKVWNILKTIIIGYGLYKAAIVLAIVAEKAHLALNTSGSLLKTAKNLIFVIQNLKEYRTALAATGMTARSFGAVLGGIIGILTAVGVAIYEVIQNSNKLSDELNKISLDEFSDFKKMADSLEDLSGKLKNAVQGSQEHRDIIRQINNVYGEYLPFVLDEKTALDAVANSTEQVIEAMKKRKMMMAQQKGEETIQNTYGDENTKSKKDLLDALSVVTNSRKDAEAIIQIVSQKINELGTKVKIFEELQKAFTSYYEGAAPKELKIFDVYESVNDLQEITLNIKKAEEELAEQNRITWGSSFRTQKAREELEKLEASFESMRKKIRFEGDTPDSDVKNAIDEINKNEKIAKIRWRVEFDGLGQAEADRLIYQIEHPLSKVIEEVNRELANQIKDQKELDFIKIKDPGKSLDEIKQETISQFQSAEKILEGLLETQKQFKGNKEVSDSIKKDIEWTQRQIELYKERARLLGITNKLQKGGDNGKDPNAERLKEQIDLIKKAQVQYEKYLQIMSPDKALKAIRTDEQFMALDIQFEPNKVRERLQMVMNDIGKLPSSPELEKLKKSIQVVFTDIDYTDAKKNFDQFLNDLTKEIDSYKEKFNIYEQILNLGGSEELAINLSGVEDGNLVDEVKKMTLKAVSEVRPTVTIETVLDQKDLPQQVQKLVDAANKAVEDAQKNNLLSAVKLLTMESPEGSGMAFDLGNVVKKYSIELLKLQNELRNALNAEGITEEQKKQIRKNADLAIEANTKIYADKAQKSGAVYAQEKIEIAGLGEAFKNMSTASYESLLKMLKITEDAKNDLISGSNAVIGFKNAGFKDEDAQRLATKEPIFKSLFDSENLEEFQVLLAQIDRLLNNSKTPTITATLGIKQEDIDKLKLWIAQQKGAATAVENTQDEINKFRVEKISKLLSQLSQNLDGVIDGIKGLSSAFGHELDEMTAGALDMLSVIVSSTTSAISTITTTTDASGKAMEATSIAASTAIKTVEKASVILAVIGAALQIATSIAGMFSKDKKLDKKIKESELRVTRLKNLYSEIERMISRNLGGADNLDLGLGDTSKRLAEIDEQLKILREKSGKNIIFRIKYSSNIKELEKEQRRLQAYNEGGVYALQRQNLIEQQNELRIQRQAEIDKKKTDQSKVADYENQIKELDDTIRHFAEDTLKDLYNIDLKDWASQIGDALFDAWKKGEDGAVAFKNKVGELMGQVMNEILKIKILEPAMQNLQNKLFGTDGQSGYFGKDFQLDENEIVDIAKSLMDVQNTTDKYNEAMNKVEEELNKYGISMKETNEEGGGLSKGIQGVSEDTSQLLASYINAIRYSVTLEELYMKNIDTNVAGIYKAMGGSPNITTTTTISPEIIAAISEPFRLSNSLLASIDMNMSNVHSIAANSLAQLVLIQANTYNAAVATSEAVEELKGVISPGHPKGGNGIKVWA